MCCHATQTFPILRALQLHRVLKKKKKNETEESGRRAVSLGGRTRAAREETHAPLFSLRESFFFFCEQEGSTHTHTHTHTQETVCWLATDTVMTECQTMGDWNRHVVATAGPHPSITPVTSGLTSAARSAFLLVRIQSWLPLLFKFQLRKSQNLENLEISILTFPPKSNFFPTNSQNSDFFPPNSDFKLKTLRIFPSNSNFVLRIPNFCQNSDFEFWFSEFASTIARTLTAPLSLTREFYREVYSDHQLYTTFHDALWDTLSELHRA